MASTTKITYKIKQLYIALACILGIVIIRLIHLQIVLNKQFVVEGKRNFLRTQTVPAPRGAILDRFGIPLATHRTLFDIYWHGSGNYRLNTEQKNILEKIGAIVNKQFLTDATMYARITNAERRRTSVVLACDISFEQLSKIEEISGNYAALSIEKRFIRFYPFQTTASHLIGYLNHYDDSYYGKMGIEKLKNEQLTGTPGIIEQTVNSVGTILAHKEIKPAIAGTDVLLTLDSSLQHLCEKAFPTDKVGAFVIIDPEAGDILASLSRPEFDPSRFLAPISKQDWQTLQYNNPFLDRVCNATYPPGSLFKLITACTALELGVATKGTQWHCNGFVSLSNRNYWCAHRQGHGLLTLKQALAFSCNAVFYELAQQLSVDALADYASCFGLGHKTGIFLPEQSGLVPSTDWKYQAKAEPWWPGETLSVAIGQSFLLVTPLQIARFIGSIFTGSIVKPRIVQDEPVEKIPLVVRKSTRVFLKKAMKAVVTDGTARRVSMIDGINLYAKTSTAQTSTLDKRSLGTAYLEHGWFAGHCSYRDNKPITFVIIVENVGSGRIATDIAKQFLYSYRDYMKQRV